MGILNVTPDSFFDGGRLETVDATLEKAQRMIDEGADIIDVGGESTRPGADAVSTDQELGRVMPVIRQLRNRCLLSIDTRNAEVARAACAEGVKIINDVSASLWAVAAEYNAAWIAMHMAGEPSYMQNAPEYQDVVAEVREFLESAVVRARADGVADIYVDPGIGFGKTTEHNLALLHHLDELVSLGVPVCVGASRKSFIGRVLGGETTPLAVEQRQEGSIIAAVFAVQRGASIVRVHDVGATSRALRMLASLEEVA